ncbi:MAG TPA: copper chaperone [Herpetosiphon sp.]|uniref:Heavy metal transport/detoxification protein n=1 Tax=Herpetosiphon aurantiacus (strain ATCC 23779 / DSM 785 / 114-95) TaxID=316274 RepID=A9AY77_HERA2|nr:heavy-metal-associated domain-containing protein [Herpetosiphon sp.]ABX06959.1 Heavy metal transport/detoxification protein [Herpetosiphon aurantiacus DSM 785]HBW52733.1 copper chaperone [Herpetosiphon sp.]
MKTESFNVPGISCQHCVNAINNEVSAVAGVQNVVVDLASKIVKVESNEQVSRDQLLTAISEAGYDVSPFANTIPLN